MGIESRISTKGQTTIPVEVREKLGLHAGDRIAFIEVDKGYLILPRNRSVTSLFGALSDFAIPGTTLEDYDRAIGDGISDHIEGPTKTGGRAVV